MTYEAWRSRMTGNAFDDTDVARCYAHRPPYAPELFDFLCGLLPRRQMLVDLGCGPGKVAAALADRFTEVVALDPSAPMIEEARRLHPAGNIRWLHASAEAAELPPQIDLVTAGTSIHWMQHDVLFPRLAERTDIVAVIVGDIPSAPPWAVEDTAFLTKWLGKIGRTYDPNIFTADGRRYETWMDVAGRREFAFTFRQGIDDYIACQHSRATWSRTRMGADIAAEFDRELKTMLTPYAKEGILTFDLKSELTWGAPRRTPN